MVISSCQTLVGCYHYVAYHFVLRLFLLTLVEILVLELRRVEQYVVNGRLELFKVRLGVFKPFLGFFQI